MHLEQEKQYDFERTAEEQQWSIETEEKLCQLVDVSKNADEDDVEEIGRELATHLGNKYGQAMNNSDCFSGQVDWHIVHDVEKMVKAAATQFIPEYDSFDEKTQQALTNFWYCRSRLKRWLVAYFTEYEGAFNPYNKAKTVMDLYEAGLRHEILEEFPLPGDRDKDMPDVGSVSEWMALVEGVIKNTPSMTFTLALTNLVIQEDSKTIA